MPAHHAPALLRLRCVALVAGTILVLDQATKAWVRLAIPLGAPDRDVIPGFLALTHRLNPGVAFSLFRSLPYAPLVFSLVAVAAISLVAWIVIRTARLSRLTLLAFGAIAGGAAGNLIDRIRPPHHVLDFIDCYVGQHHWPAFNIADSSICIGAALLILASLTEPHFPGAPAPPSSSTEPGSPQ